MFSPKVSKRKTKLLHRSSYAVCICTCNQLGYRVSCTCNYLLAWLCGLQQGTVANHSVGSTLDNDIHDSMCVCSAYAHAYNIHTALYYCKSMFTVQLGCVTTLYLMLRLGLWLGVGKIFPKSHYFYSFILRYWALYSFRDSLLFYSQLGTHCVQYLVPCSNKMMWSFLSRFILEIV